MKKQIVLALLAFQVAAFSASATIEINFDIDASGNPITAPDLFENTTRLTEVYAPLGIHFFGPDGSNGRDGGAILDQKGNFGVAALSGPNFLAFNRGIPMMDGGNPQDPEIITFDMLATNISIFAAGGHDIKTFLMEGFDADGMLVASDTVITQGWAELEVAWSLGIRSVRLSVTIPDPGFSNAFVFDDLSVDFVPEPSTISLLICAAAIGLALRFRKRRT
jgi:hypothetical protein